MKKDKKSETLYSVCFWIVAGIFCFLLVWILIALIRNPKELGDLYKPVEYKSYVPQLICYILCIPLLAFAGKRFFSFSIRRVKLWYGLAVGIVTACCLVFLCLVYTRLWLYYQTDNMWLHLGSAMLAGGGTLEGSLLDYFAIHSQNVFLLFLFTNILRVSALFGVESTYVPLLVVQYVVVCAAAVLVAILFYRLIRSKVTAFLFWLVFVLYAAMMPSLTIPYTDGYSLWCVPAVLLLYFWRPQKVWKDRLRYAFIGVIVFVGYKIKAQVVVVFVALLIVDFVRILSGKMPGGWWLLLFELIGLAGGWIFTTVCIATLRIDLNHQQSLTFLHYWYMGLNASTFGQYSNEDWLFSLDKGRGADLRGGLERLREFGFFGYLSFLNDKLAVVYQCSDFGFSDCFYATLHNDPDFAAEGIVGLVTRSIYVGGAGHEAFLQWTSVFWAFVWGCPVFIAAALRKKREEDMALLLSIVGIVLFTLLFEANFRYIYGYLPVLLLIGARGAESIGEVLQEKIPHRKKTASASA